MFFKSSHRLLSAVFFATLLVLASPQIRAEFRTWTSSDGKTVEAELVGKTDTVAKLKLRNGVVAEVALTRLSPADQEFVASATIEAAPTFSVQAGDWPNYLGPNFDAVSPESTVPEAPKTVWKKEVGMGSGSFAIVGDRGYVMGHNGDEVVVTCFDTATGKDVWTSDFLGSATKNNFPGGGTPFLGGPNATPAVDGDRVYTMSRFGHVHCWDAASGKKIWELEFDDEFPGYELPQWGFAASVLIDGNHAYVEPGSRGAATVCLDKMTGKVVWKSGNQSAGYATPKMIEIGGKKTLVCFNRSGLTGRDPERGTELWHYDWETSYGVNAASPTAVGDNKIFITSGYGTGCAMVEISGGSVRELWKNKAMKVKHGVPVFYDGNLYGFDENDLVCLDPKTGEARWRQGGMGKGALMVAGGKLVIQAESSELIIAEASPDGYREISKSGKLFDRHSWTIPVLSGGMIFTRNISGTVVCLK